MTSRKDFLIGGTLAAAALPAAAQAAAPAPGATALDWPKLAFDLKAFNAGLDGTQTHKHLYTSVEIENGTAFAMVQNTMLAYQQIGTPPSDITTAAVFYHGTAVLLGFDDVVWNTYIIPLAKSKKVSPRMAAPQAQISTYLPAKPAGNPATAQIARLAQGASLRLYLCNEATRGFASAVAETLSLNAIEVYRTMTAHLLPSAMLTPTGVWAVHAVQEHHYTLLPVTVS
jgi:hypothetical protein